MRTFAVCLSMILGAAAAPTRSADAHTVNTDSVPVYSATSTSSAVLQKLSKGEAVGIEYMVTTAEGQWCSLSTPARGDVLCSYLKHGEPPPQEASDAPLPPVLIPPPASHAPARRVEAPVVKAPVTPAPAEPAMFTP